MNILAIGMLGLLMLLTVQGYRKGLIRKLVGLVAWIITLWLVSMTVPYIVEFLKENTSLHAALQGSITGSDVELMQMLKLIGLEEMAGNFVADRLLELLGFVVTFALVSLVVHGIAAALHIAAKLPLLNGTNRLLGALLGFLEGILLIWMLFLVIGAFGTSSWGSTALYWIAESELLTWMFVNNPLLLLMAG